MAPKAASQVARALQVGRATLYWPSKQAVKDKQVAVAIEAWYEIDDTLGHRKLAALLKMSKDRVRRVMHKYGITARRKRKKYVYPGRASEIAPNLLRELTEGRDPEIVFSDILVIKLADATRGASLLCALETDPAYSGHRLCIPYSAGSMDQRAVNAVLS